MEAGSTRSLAGDGHSPSLLATSASGLPLEPSPSPSPESPGGSAGPESRSLRSATRSIRTLPAQGARQADSASLFPGVVKSTYAT